MRCATCSCVSPARARAPISAAESENAPSSASYSCWYFRLFSSCGAHQRWCVSLILNLLSLQVALTLLQVRVYGASPRRICSSISVAQLGEPIAMARAKGHPAGAYSSSGTVQVRKKSTASANDSRACQVVIRQPMSVSGGLSPITRLIHYVVKTLAIWPPSAEVSAPAVNQF